MAPLIPIFYTFSLPSYSVSISPSLAILYFSICPFPLIFSHKAIALVFLLYLLIYLLIYLFQQANSSSGACSAGCDSTPCLHFPPSSGSAVPSQCCSPETPTARSSLSSHLSSLSRLRKIMEGRQVDTRRGETCHTHCSQPF